MCSVKHNSDVHRGSKTEGLYLELGGGPLGLNTGSGERTLTVFGLYFLQGTPSFRVWFGCLDFSLVLCFTFFMTEQTETLLFLCPPTQYLYSRVGFHIFCSVVCVTHLLSAGKCCSSGTILVKYCGCSRRKCGR